MSEYNKFMLNTLESKIKKCNEIYKNLKQYHHYGSVILINNILIELNDLHESEDLLKNKIIKIDLLRNRINPKIIFKNRYILPNCLNFCDEVRYAIAWGQDYYKGLITKNNKLL